MKRGYSQFEHTADIGISATGSDLRELFTNFALGLFDVICDMKKVLPRENIMINVNSYDRESLLVKWLNELIYIFDFKKMLFSKFDIKEITDTGITAVASGEKIDLKKHELRELVKAATFHQLSIKKNRQYKGKIILDV
ncbi:MAG: archease [Actinobacteria bacterium]|nr:archease [Actinomycetota bacterium]